MKLSWRPALGEFRGDPCEADEEYKAEGVRGTYWLTHYTGRGKVKGCDRGWQLSTRIHGEVASYHLKNRAQGEDLAQKVDEAEDDW